MFNKKGFTLIELLAVMVILGLVLIIAIPTITGVTERIKKDTFASAARMMIASAREKVSDDPNILMPPNNYDATLIKLAYLNLENMNQDVDNGYYNKINTYVLVVKINDELVYYATVDGSKRRINLAKEGTIDRDVVFSQKDIVLPKTVGETYTSAELGEIETFTATVKYVY
jgi:type IV pilus assembly protein PilA